MVIIVGVYKFFLSHAMRVKYKLKKDERDLYINYNDKLISYFGMGMIQYMTHFIIN